jgi:ketosteroid isomerase-like protein
MKEVEMSADANTETLRVCYEKFLEGDIPGLVEHFADDIEITIPEIENAPYGGILHGRLEAAAYLDLLAETEEITDYEPREFIVQGDRVVVLGRSTATVRSTGRHYSTEWVHVVTLKDNKIVNLLEYFDTAAALRAFQKVTTALS